MIPFSSYLYVTRREELTTARRFLVAGSVAHAAAAVVALGSAQHPAWLVIAPVATFARTPGTLAAVGLTSLFLALLCLMVAVGMRTRQAWAPRMAFGVAVAGLLNAPFGTLASLLVLAFLFASMEHVPGSARRQTARGARAAGPPYL